MVRKTVAEINQYEGTTVNPMQFPDQVYELYSVPSFDTEYPEIIAGADIGSSKATVQEGDVLICKINPRINRVWVVKHNTEHPLLASSEWIVVRNPGMDSDYLRWYFSSPTFRTLLNSEVAGIGGSLTRAQPKRVAQYTVPICPFEEQQRISTSLNQVESLISLRKQQIAKLNELVKARFVEMFGDPEVNLHGFEIKSIGELVSVEPQNGMYKPQSSYVQDGTGTPILRIDAFYNGKVTDFHSLKRLTCAKAEIEKYLLHEHDIVINRVNSLEYLGKCAHIVGMYEPTVFESNMMRLHLDDTRADPCFITHLLCSDYVRKQIMNRAKKAVNQASINQNDVQSLLVLVPPVVLQHQFAAFVAQTDQQKLTIQHSLAQLELLKKALMQKYFG